MKPLVEIRGLHKSYNAPVLVDFDLEIGRGEARALMGSNGAGKSTLAKILSGLVQPEAGRIELDGVPYAPRNKQDAIANGVVMVMQELNLIPTLSIAENLFFRQLPSRFGLVRKRELRRRATEALTRVHLQELDPDLPAGSLGVGQQQLVEIAAALAQDCRLLILDEPTSTLTDPEIETLFEQARRLQSQGVAILYVSHRMEEIRKIATSVSVMRDGALIATHDAQEVSQATIVAQMAGKDVWVQRGERRELADAPVVLEARHLQAPPKVEDLSLFLRQGEILGLAGLVGSGRTECLRTLFGADPARNGELFIHGQPARIEHPAQAVALGIGMVPEDRKSEGLLLDLALSANATLASLDRFSRRGLLDQAAERRACAAGVQDLEIMCDRIEQPVGELSGGNQQKVVMLRWLLRQSRILLLDEPTRGVDVAAKESIYRLLRHATRDGVSLIVVSSELVELMALCDRIAVFADGRITQTFEAPHWTQEALTKASFGSFLAS